MADVNPLDAIYGGFQRVTPLESSQLLDGFDGLWWIGGGWAIEAFTKAPRPHEDLDICIDRNSIGALIAHFEGSLHVWAVGSGTQRPLLRPGEALPDWSGQIWVREGYGQPWLVDFLLSPIAGDTWIFKRNPFLTLPISEATWIADDGLQYERPQVSLLYKAKHNRPKDRADFEAALPLMDTAAVNWLADSLAVAHPGHPWLEKLRAFDP